MKSGKEGNIFRYIENTPLQERFKANKDGSLEYRVDIKGVGPKKVGGHLTAENFGFGWGSSGVSGSGSSGGTGGGY